MVNRKIAEELIKHYDIRARQGRYREDGKWYHHLERFPAAFFDQNGYIVFETEAKYRNCPYLQLGQDVNIRHHGISGIPGYVKYPDGARY